MAGSKGQGDTCGGKKQEREARCRTGQPGRLLLCAHSHASACVRAQGLAAFPTCCPTCGR